MTREHGWTLDAVAIAVPGSAEPIPCASLVGSVATGECIRDRAVLLRHEYISSLDTIHRCLKLRAAAAAEASAAAIGIAQPVPGFGVERSTEHA